METPKARITDHRVTTVDQPADTATTLEITTPTMTPARPTDDADGEALHEKEGSDVDLARTDGSPDADLTGPFEDRGQHDVRDPDSADEQRDPGDRPHDDVEEPLGLPALFEQGFGHHEFEVLFAAVQTTQKLVHQASGFAG